LNVSQLLATVSAESSFTESSGALVLPLRWFGSARAAREPIFSSNLFIAG
jgi:hypothetical protein